MPSAAPLETWQRLMSPEAEPLRAAAAAIDPYDAAAVGRLRRDWNQDLVRIALQLARARDKAAAKFGPRAASLVADPQGVEMASSAIAAAHKAARFAAAFPRGIVLDLCCGIGGDSMGLAAAGLRVIAVDRDPVRAWMAGLNVGCDSRCTDAADPTLPDGPFHLDPARRSDDGARRHRWEDLEPGPEVIRGIIRRRRDGAVKLGPGVNVDALPPGEVEILSEHGRLTQAILWVGALSRGDRLRTATMLPAGLSISGAPSESPVAPATGRYLLEPDDSVERAGLLSILCAQLNAAALHPRLGLLTADNPAPRPWVNVFEVIEELPWNERRAAERLRALRAGIVEIKTRGGVVDPDPLQRRLSSSEGEPLTLFVLRFGRALRAIITRRVQIR